jgi:hypothetical protein
LGRAASPEASCPLRHYQFVHSPEPVWKPAGAARAENSDVWPTRQFDKPNVTQVRLEQRFSTQRKYLGWRVVQTCEPKLHEIDTSVLFLSIPKFATDCGA